MNDLRAPAAAAIHQALLSLPSTQGQCFLVLTGLFKKGLCLDELVRCRFNMLEEEKRLLHHQIQMLSRQNCSLESALRKSASTLEVAPLKQVLPDWDVPPRMTAHFFFFFSKLGDTSLLVLLT